MLVIRTVPACVVKYTTDFGDPANTGTVYKDPGVEAVEGAVIRLFAEKGPVSREEQVTVPTSGGGGGGEEEIPLDPAKPASVAAKNTLKLGTRAETWKFLQTLPKTATMQRVSAKVAVAASNSTVTVNWDNSIRVDAARVMKAFDFLDGELADGEWNLRFEHLHFETGKDLQQWQVDSGTKLDPKLITQPS